MPAPGPPSPAGKPRLVPPKPGIDKEYAGAEGVEGPPLSSADQAKAQYGSHLTGKDLKKAKNAIKRQNDPNLAEKNSLRSQMRRQERECRIKALGAVKDFAIAKGGRQGRLQLEQVLRAWAEGDEATVYDIVKDFQLIPQPRFLIPLLYFPC